MKQLLTLEDVKAILKRSDGESIPLFLISKLTIYYFNGTDREIPGCDIPRLFPTAHRTNDIMANNKKIAEISGKVDIEKVGQFLNSYAALVAESVQVAAKKAIAKRR